jgi:hypothetical protein
MLGRMEDVVRLPLMPLALEHHESVWQALQSAGAL